MAALARLLGLDRGLAGFYRAAAGDPVLGDLAQAFCGLKPPRFPTLFETLVNAFACQQVTLSLGILLLNRLAEACAPELDGPGGRAFAFPSPEDLAGRAPDELRALGFSRQKARAIIELARALAEHRLDLDAIEQFDDRAAVARLRALRGVGRWTAEYVLLRGLGRLHVFPGDDVGARNNLQRWLGLSGAARLRRGATDAREVAAVPGPGLPAPSAQSAAARGRAPFRTHTAKAAARATGCCAERAKRKWRTLCRSM